MNTKDLTSTTDVNKKPPPKNSGAKAGLLSKFFHQSTQAFSDSADTVLAAKKYINEQVKHLINKFFEEFLKDKPDSDKEAFINSTQEKIQINIKEFLEKSSEHEKEFWLYNSLSKTISQELDPNAIRWKGLVSGSENELTTAQRCLLNLDAEIIWLAPKLEAEQTEQKFRRVLGP